jgi:hypothetical protein
MQDYAAFAQYTRDDTCSIHGPPPGTRITILSCVRGYLCTFILVTLLAARSVVCCCTWISYGALRGFDQTVYYIYDH